MRQDLFRDLRVVAGLIPPQALRQIAAACHLFVNRSNSRNGAEVHWVKKGVKARGFKPRKLAVEINDWESYKNDLLNREGTLLHELSHVFNGTIGREHPVIEAMYQRAVETRRYESVAMCDGTEGVRAYGLTDPLEFFASLSVAYLGGRNDYFPFNREDLKAFDPESYSDVAHIWSLAGETASG